ncbi:unnamed protein product [Malus baccata var. baccata]
MGVAEMRMLRGMCEHTRKDKIGNEDIRGTGVSPSRCWPGGWCMQGPGFGPWDRPSRLGWMWYTRARETPNVEAIQVDRSYIEKQALKHVELKKMSNLTMLIVHSDFKLNASLDLPDSLRFNASLDLPDSLCYLTWPSYPLESLPSNFCPENLVELHMPCSKVANLWKEEQILVNLQVINLRHSKNLTEVPNLSGSLKIVKMDLSSCLSLVEVPSYFQHLDKLTHLDLGGCRSLKYLPEMPGNIQYLDLGGNGIKELPESIWSNENISYLNISKCYNLEKLPSNRCEMKISGCFNLDRCTFLSEFSELPRDVSKLSLVYCKRLVSLPTNICKLKYLKELNLSGCSQLKNFPEILEPMEHLASLRAGLGLSLQGTAIEMLPDGLVCSTALQKLNLSGTKVRSIPANIKQASRLSELGLVGCKQLQSLPELPVLCSVDAEGCTSLKTLSSTGTALTQGVFGFAMSAVIWGKLAVWEDSFKVEANFCVKFMGESHKLCTGLYIPHARKRYYQSHVLVWSVDISISPDYKLANEASVYFWALDSFGEPISPVHMRVLSCGISPLYAEDAEKFKFDHVFMSTEPKVEETRQDDDSEGGRSRDEPEACGSSGV